MEIYVKELQLGSPWTALCAPLQSSVCKSPCLLFYHFQEAQPYASCLVAHGCACMGAQGRGSHPRDTIGRRNLLQMTPQPQCLHTACATHQLCRLCA